ncbi:MAG: hypothetical protein ACI9QA_000087, partial [Methanobacteriota archaeon]
YVLTYPVAVHVSVLYPEEKMLLMARLCPERQGLEQEGVGRRVVRAFVLAMTFFDVIQYSPSRLAQEHRSR